MFDLVFIDLQIKLLLFLILTFSCFSFGLFFCFFIGTLYDWSLILYGTSSDPLEPLPEVDTTLRSHTILTSDVNIIEPTEPSRNPTRTEPAPTKPQKPTKPPPQPGMVICSLSQLVSVRYRFESRQFLKCFLLLFCISFNIFALHLRSSFSSLVSCCSACSNLNRY